MNSAWGATKVKYHILTKPFTVMNYNNTGVFEYRSNIRVEALLCESEETTIGLPEQFISPLATNFRYWTATKSDATKKQQPLYDYGHDTKIINVKYDIYLCTAENKYACFEGDSIPKGSPVDSYTDIYVTYDYINDDKSVGYKNGILELDGGTDYNVSIMNGVEKFMCYNRSRNNRVANANSAGLSGEDLASDEFVKPQDGTAANQLGWNYSKWGPHGLFAGFMFTGKDPYNITIMTSYKGDQLHITDGIAGVDDKKATVKPYAGSSLMAKIGATSLWFDASNNKHYKIFSGCNSEKDWTDAKYKELHDYYWAPEQEGNRYDDWVGFYRNESPTLSTFALLPNKAKGGYMFVGSKLNQNNTQQQPQPNTANYYSYFDNYDKETGVPRRSQPYFKLQSLGSAYATNFYEIKEYTVYVKTHGSGTTLSTTMKWSDARLNDNPADHVPEALKRKYCSYTAYSDAACTVPANTFKAIQDANNDMKIYLKYAVSESLPFDTLRSADSYQDARWYTMRMDGVTNPKYIAYKGDGSNNVVVTNGSGAAKGSNTPSQVHQGENSAEAMVAFMGDPYELKILNRKACEDASGKRFIGCDTGSETDTGLTTNKAGSSDISTWEIVYESGGVDGFLLRQFNTVADPKYIGLGDATNNKPVTYSATESRIKVVELEEVTYTYHIMRNDAGDIAVKASATHDIGKMLNSWMDIPDIIRSPFLSTATVTYYASLADAKAKTNAITNAPYDYSTNDDIYVRYDVSISGSTYNVRLNNEYIYTDGTDIIKNKPLLDDGDKDDGAFQWLLDYSDPYHMTIKNSGKAKYVNVAFSDGASINWSDDTPSYFVAKSGSIVGTYEVMAATGDGIDASVTYYNIGRPSANTVKLYSNSSYIHGNAVLRFQLIGTNATRIYYHLIDKKGKDLLQATTRQTTTDAPDFPPEYYSPLVSAYHYYALSSFDIDGDTYTLKPAQSELPSVSGNEHIYVTYDVNDLVDLKAGQLYLMKYEAGETFHQEDGSDGVNPTAQKAIYPYVNGDGNFFVYGQEQYELQQQGASSTRTRWAWYVESNVEGAPKGDPYHVTIKSRQTEQYPIVNYSEYNAYFMTYKPDDYTEVITTLGWPGMNSETATEYMVLGSEGQYQLVTTNKIGESRYVVNSFEQYWKTFDTIKKKIYGSSTENDNDPIIIPNDVTKGGKTLRNYLKEDLRWHSYEKWAYAKRWNGYNNGYSSEVGTHEKKKGWEKVEHWYQTVKMGEGYFDFVKTSIDPVLILLDQHGFEIMRKPLPTDPDDPKKDEKYAAIRPYNSPMVKEYAFWATAKKRTGLHQYYALADRIGGDDFTSTDLTNLPPYGSKNVKDKKGNLNDQYVTYIVKDEYALTYTPSDKSAKPFLIEQGTKYASTSDGTTIAKNNVPAGGMKKFITDALFTTQDEWYVKPNATIDTEMGYGDVQHTWTDPDPDDPDKWNNKNPNAYDHYLFKDARAASYISTPKALTDSLGYFSFSNGFDPYNIQIESVQASAKFMKTDATNATLEEGSMIGVYEASPEISLNNNTAKISPKWYDSRTLSVTNATFMAVQDAAGNMQLMPRFDHSTRMSEFGTLIAPTDAQVATTYTKLYRPVVYHYLIIDNDGHESLRYKAGGDMAPQTPDHFQSPLATNFTYYAKATKDGDTYTIDKTKEIEGSLDGATLTDNKVYVRYEYNEERDDLNMLKGNWLTMQLDEKDAINDDGEVDVHIKQGTSKPSTIGNSAKAWQWKFLETPQSTPDPYALYIYNRSQTAGTKAVADRFALLSHSEGDYALAKAGLGTYTYQFLNGSGMNTTTAATIAVESGFTPTTDTFDGKNSQVKLTDDVQHTFIYKVYTNGGANAIDASQTQETVITNDWRPELPEAARTPLLNIDQYRYYEATTDTVGKSLSVLYGLYDDLVYTRYTAYNPNVSNYLVPNVRNNTDVDPVAPGVGSNDAPVGLDGKRPYNIYWHQDNIMKSNGTSITSEANQPLKYDAAYEWEFEGDDPYAIKIKSVGSSGNYIHKDSEITTNLDAEATTFMLLNREGYDYGVFAVTGDASKMLSGNGDALTTSAPTKFIPFALSTYKVIYHLMIKNIGTEGGIVIPYRDPDTKVLDPYHYIKPGTTLRDLTTKNTSGGEAGHIAGDQYQLGVSLKTIRTELEGLFARDSIYCVDAGHISLGDAFEVPQAFYRPNVSYDYYIEGVYSADGQSEITAMNDEYKGLKMTNLGDDNGLLGNIVFVNIVYNFTGGLDTNSGSDFVKSVSQNKWYTFETNDVTPMLAEYSGSLQTKSGYATHYTNDYLWTPVGDPYGFKMYNRYMYKNLGEKKVMSTSGFVNNEPIVMVEDNAGTPYVPHLPANSVYELLAINTTTPGYFRIHPVVNKEGTQFYMKNVVSDGTGVIKLNTAPTDWTFGLSEEVMKPYYQTAGYIGGLNSAGKAAYDKAAAKTDPLERLMAIQDVVYNHDNDGTDPEHPNYIVHYEDGYYRLHSQPGSSGITTPRYMSGYTHAIERDVDGNGNESDAIPMHFYEVEKYDINNPTFGDLESDQYTTSPATRGDIPLVTVGNDPASIFRFTQGEGGITLSTQGLYVKENKMTATEGDATKFDIVDIGAGIVALQQHGGTHFLKYAQNTKKYDLKYDNTAETVESARWCMKPVQKAATAGNGEMPLKVTTKNGGDDYYYTTFYAPFDVLLTSANDVAYVVKDALPTMTTDKTLYIMRPKKIGESNTTGTYVGSNQFIPANTPVIIRTKNTGGEVTMALPNETPSTPVACVFSGQYLEQMLTQNSSDYVFVFGRSYTHSDGFTYNESTGEVTPSGLEFDKGVGFYKNANTNRESNATKTLWSRNNKYVYGNKVYYRGTIEEPSSDDALNLDFENTEYIPVLFDEQGVKDMDLQPDGTMRLRINDGRAYDIQGRCVATEQEVSDGSWLNNVASGMYIVNGKKFVIE